MASGRSNPQKVRLSHPDMLFLAHASSSVLGLVVPPFRSNRYRELRLENLTGLDDHRCFGRYIFIVHLCANHYAVLAAGDVLFGEGLRPGLKLGRDVLTEFQSSMAQMEKDVGAQLSDRACQKIPSRRGILSTGGDEGLGCVGPSNLNCTLPASALSAFVTFISISPGWLACP